MPLKNNIYLMAMVSITFHCDLCKGSASTSTDFSVPELSLQKDKEKGEITYKQANYIVIRFINEAMMEVQKLLLDTHSANNGEAYRALQSLNESFSNMIAPWLKEEGKTLSKFLVETSDAFPLSREDLNTNIDDFLQKVQGQIAKIDEHVGGLLGLGRVNAALFDQFFIKSLAVISERTDALQRIIKRLQVISSSILTSGPKEIQLLETEINLFASTHLSEKHRQFIDSINEPLASIFLKFKSDPASKFSPNDGMICSQVADKYWEIIEDYNRISRKLTSIKKFIQWYTKNLHNVEVINRTKHRRSAPFYKGHTAPNAEKLEQMQRQRAHSLSPEPMVEKKTQRKASDPTFPPMPTRPVPEVPEDSSDNETFVDSKSVFDDGKVTQKIILDDTKVPVDNDALGGGAKKDLKQKTQRSHVRHTMSEMPLASMLKREVLEQKDEKKSDQPIIPPQPEREIKPLIKTEEAKPSGQKGIFDDVKTESVIQ